MYCVYLQWSLFIHFHLFIFSLSQFEDGKLICIHLKKTNVCIVGKGYIFAQLAKACNWHNEYFLQREEHEFSWIQWYFKNWNVRKGWKVWWWEKSGSQSPGCWLSLCSWLALAGHVTWVCFLCVPFPITVISVLGSRSYFLLSPFIQSAIKTSRINFL